MYTILLIALWAGLILTPTSSLFGLIMFLTINFYLFKKAFGWDLIKDIKGLLPLIKKLK